MINWNDAISAKYVAPADTREGVPDFGYFQNANGDNAFAKDGVQVGSFPPAREDGFTMLLDNRTGFAAEMQAVMTASLDYGPVVTSAGTGVLDSKAGDDPGLDRLLLGSTVNEDGEDKTISIRGAGRDKSFLLAGTTAEFFLRYEATASAPMSVAISDITLQAGTFMGASTRPLAFFQNVIFDIRNASLEGRYDLLSGSGTGGTGYFTGYIVGLKTRDGAGTGRNFGAGYGSGGFVTDGTRPEDLHFIGDQHRNSKSHFWNVHSGKRISTIGGHYSHNVPLLGYRATNGGIRFGNGGMELIALGCFVDGAWRGIQADDYKHVIVEATMVLNSGGPGIASDKKDYPSEGFDFSGAYIIDPARNRGHPNPNSTDDDDFSVTNEEFAGVLIRGGGGHVSPSRPIRSDVRPVWNGRIVAIKGQAIVYIIDSDFVGNNYVALSKVTPADGLYLGPTAAMTKQELRDNLNKPEALGYISTVDLVGQPVGCGGIGPRKFYDGPNGSGTLLGEVSWGENIPDAWRVDGGSVVQEVTLCGGALHDIGTFADIGNPALFAGEKFRMRILREEFVQVGYSEFAPSGLVANVWRPTWAPNYYRFGPANALMDADAASKEVFIENMDLETTIGPQLDDGSPVNLFTQLPSGRWQFVGVVDYVDDTDTLFLTENALATVVDGAVMFTCENSMSYGVMIGDPNRTKAGLEQLGYNHWWNYDNLVIGYGIAPHHIFIECCDPRCFPVEAMRIEGRNFDLTAPGRVVDVAIPKYGWRQRMAFIDIVFSDAIAGDITDHIIINLNRRRGTARDTIATTGPLYGIAAGVHIDMPVPMPDITAKLQNHEIVNPDKEGDFWELAVVAVGAGIDMSGIRGRANLGYAGW